MLELNVDKAKFTKAKVAKVAKLPKTDFATAKLAKSKCVVS